MARTAERGDVRYESAPGFDSVPGHDGETWYGIDDDQVVIPFSAALLADGLADARWLLHDALLSGARRIVIDLSRVSHLASPALASFLWAHRICRARGGGLALRGVDRRTRDMLYRTGLWRVLEMQTKGGRTIA